MPPQTKKQAEKALGANPIPSSQQTGQSGGPAGMTFTESVSNPNIGVTQQEAQEQQQQIQNQNQDNNQEENQEENQLGNLLQAKKDEKEKKKSAVEFFKTAFEKLKGKDLTKPITDQELALYRALVGNQQANMPDYSILESFVKNLGAMGKQVNPITRYLGLGEDDGEFFRDDNEGLNLAKLRELERELTGDEQKFPFYGEIVDGGIATQLPGSLTLEGRTKFIDDMLGSEFEERLKRQMPDVYYPDNYMPATSGGLADLGSQAAINTTGMDRESDEYKQAVKYNNMIFSARAELDRMGKDMFGNTQGGGQGGGGGIPSVATPVTPPPSGPTPPPQQPTLPPGITPPLNPSTRFPNSVITDYTQLGLPQIYGNQQIPNYANFYQGQQPVGLQNYLDALRRRFGIG